MPETPNEKTLREFRHRLESNHLDKWDETRIDHFIEQYPSKHWTRKQVIEDCLTNEKLCAKMATEARRQNLDEVKIIEKIGAKKLKATGKSNIRFRMDDGDIVIGEKANYNLTKSADFVMEYKGVKHYGS